VDTDKHTTLVGELDGVVGEIGDHLTETGRIADQHVGHVSAYVEAKAEALFMGAGGKQADHIFGQRIDRKRNGFEFQFSPTRSSTGRECR
jgi:hypothetical protein